MTARAAARVTLLGIPYDASSSFRRGCAAAPPRIRDALASDQNNGWSESLVDLRAPGMIGDAGDVEVGSSAEMRPRAEAAVARILASGSKPLCLGGDHSVTYPILRAMRAKHPKLSILHFDAHPDLYDHLDGDRYSHACPFARILEEQLAVRLVQVGIRTMNAHQRSQSERFGVEVIHMKDWDDARILSFDEPLYVSVDLDVLDPAFAPGLSHREPGGCSVRQLISAIQQVRATIVGANVVEFNPSEDSVGLTAWVAAKITRELAARMVD